MIKEVIQGMKMAKTINAIEGEKGDPDRPYYGNEQNLIDRVSIVSYMHNFLRVVPVPLKQGQVGNLWGVGGVAEATDAILAHMDRAAIREREKA
jgi:hypothetical protein